MYKYNINHTLFLSLSFSNEKFKTFCYFSSQLFHLQMIFIFSSHEWKWKTAEKSLVDEKVYLTKESC